MLCLRIHADLVDGSPFALAVFFLSLISSPSQANWQEGSRTCRKGGRGSLGLRLRLEGIRFRSAYLPQGRKGQFSVRGGGSRA